MQAAMYAKHKMRLVTWYIKLHEWCNKHYCMITCPVRWLIFIWTKLTCRLTCYPWLIVILTSLSLLKCKCWYYHTIYPWQKTVMYLSWHRLSSVANPQIKLSYIKLLIIDWKTQMIISYHSWFLKQELCLQSELKLQWTF